MTFYSFRDIKIGTVLIPGKDGFEAAQGINSEIIRQPFVVIGKSTKERLLKQFEDAGVEIKRGTLEDINDPNVKFYEVITD